MGVGFVCVDPEERRHRFSVALNRGSRNELFCWKGLVCKGFFTVETSRTIQPSDFTLLPRPSPRVTTESFRPVFD